MPFVALQTLAELVEPASFNASVNGKYTILLFLSKPVSHDRPFSQYNCCSFSVAHLGTASSSLFKRSKRRHVLLLDRLNKDDDAVPRCATEKLQQLYCEKGLSWLTGFDKNNKIVYFPLTLALKDAGSTSSARVCSATNGI